MNKTVWLGSLTALTLTASAGAQEVPNSTNLSSLLDSGFEVVSMTSTKVPPPSSRSPALSSKEQLAMILRDGNRNHYICHVVTDYAGRIEGQLCALVPKAVQN